MMKNMEKVYNQEYNKKSKRLLNLQDSLEDLKILTAEIKEENKDLLKENNSLHSRYEIYENKWKKEVKIYILKVKEIIRNTN